MYVYRDGRDAAVSFYHHLRDQSVDDGGFEGGWDRFFERWIDGQIAFGRGLSTSSVGAPRRARARTFSRWGTKSW